MRGLADRVALVTGATGLLGTAISRRLAEEGCRVAAASRDLKKVEGWVSEQPQAVRPRLHAAELDLSQEKSIAAFFRGAASRSQMPTILVANASLRDGMFPGLKDLTLEHFSRLFSVDVGGHFLCARSMVEHLPAKQPASIVFLSSIYAVAGVDPSLYAPEPPPGMVNYAAVKSAMSGLVRSMASHWGSRGVRVNAVVAGGIRSRERQAEEFAAAFGRKTLLGRMAAADEVASAVAFLASDEASYITGESLVVDGGFSAW